MIIRKKGWYRLVLRIVIHTNSGHHVTIMINGSHKYYCYHYGYSRNYYKTYNFNEIINFNKNDKIKIYASKAAYCEPTSSYLCLETIPSDLLSEIGVYNSTTSSSNYRVWNNAVKSCDNYISNSYQLKFKKSGLYRISARVHTQKSTVQQPVYMTISQNNGNQTKKIYNYQSYPSSAASYRCFNFEDIVQISSTSDFIAIYDQGYGSSNIASYESLSIEPIISSGIIGSWHSSSSSSNIRY